MNNKFLVITKKENKSHIIAVLKINDINKNTILEKYSEQDYIYTYYEESSITELFNKNFPAKAVLNSILSHNSILDSFYEKIEDIYREHIIMLAISYMLNYPKIKMISKSDYKYNELVTEDSLYEEFYDFAIIKDGIHEPLEYDKLKHFLNEFSVSGDYESDGKYHLYSIRDVVYTGINIDDTIVDTFINDFKITNYTFDIFECDPEVLDLFFKSKYVRNYFYRKSISNIIVDILTGELGKLGNEDFYSIYLEGCKLLNEEITFKFEYIENPNSYYSGLIYEKISQLDLSEKSFIGGFNPSLNNVPKKVDRLVRDINSQCNEKVVKSERLIEAYLLKLRHKIIELNKYMKFATKNNLELKTPIDFTKALKKISEIESYKYYSHEICIPLTEMLEHSSCVYDLYYHGIDFVATHTFVNENTKKDIIRLIPASPELEYPEARKMDRHFIIHVGPTNSGKTYQALEELKKANTGVYLGPLRLLALEIQDKLLADGVKCSLLTGEEEQILEDGTHMASTVEKLDPTKNYDVCVIDEVQMIGDPERGFAWTRAILGVKAKTIYLCMAPEALDIVKELINLCDNTYEIIEHTRRSELVVEDKKFLLKKENICKYDALIVFSKKKVLTVAATLIGMGIKASLIYGSLPYAVRKKQVERFLKGETDVIVSTDAIGMGINLPVRRIIFLETEKFNGKETVPLSITSVKQIAGRAGRNKETGYVASTDYVKNIKRKLESDTPKVETAYLGFSDEIISINAPLCDILKVWKTIKTDKIFKRMNIDRYLDLDSKLYVNVTKKEKLKMLTIAFDENNQYVFDLWKQYCFEFESKIEDISKPILEGTELNDYENYYKGLDLYYAFARNFGYYIDIEWVTKEKQRISENINDCLVKDIAKNHRRCKYCGRILRWDYPFNMCSKCYNNQY